MCSFHVYKSRSSYDHLLPSDDATLCQNYVTLFARRQTNSDFTACPMPLQCIRHHQWRARLCSETDFIIIYTGVEPNVQRSTWLSPRADPGICERGGGGVSPSLPLPFSSPLHFSLPSLPPLEVGPLKPARRSGRAL